MKAILFALFLILPTFGYAQDVVNDPSTILANLKERYPNICEADVTTINVNAQDDNGKTLLMYAAENLKYSWDGRSCLIDELLLAGADVDVKDNAGKTVMDYTSPRNHMLYFRTFSKVPVKYTNLPPTEELYRQRYGDEEPFDFKADEEHWRKQHMGEEPLSSELARYHRNAKLSNFYLKLYILVHGEPYLGSDLDMENVHKDNYQLDLYNPDNSQFCRDIASGKIAFGGKNTIKYDNISYRLDLEWSGGSMGGKHLNVIRLDDNSSYDMLFWNYDFESLDVMSYKDELYVQRSKNYYKFRPDLMALEQVCKLHPVKPTYTAVKPSKICNQVLSGDYKKYKPQPLEELMSEEYAVVSSRYTACHNAYNESVRTTRNYKLLIEEYKKCIDEVPYADNENGKFLRDYFYLQYDNEHSTSFDYYEKAILADYNNDGTTEILIPKHYESSSRPCAFSFYTVYKGGKYDRIDDRIFCDDQEIISIDSTYLLLKDNGNIDALHRVFTREDGLNDIEEVCKFEVHYEYW